MKVDIIKWLVSISTACWVNYYRSGLAVAIICGSLVNSIASKLLKRVFDQPRPAGANEQGLKDPGPHIYRHILEPCGQQLCCAIFYVYSSYKISFLTKFDTCNVIQKP